MIIFFDSKSKLKEFKKFLLTSNIKFLKKISSLKETTLKKDTIIKNAGKLNQLTLATRSFGRGTDFRSTN